VKKTWKPTVVGILDVISGAIFLFGLLFLFTGAAAFLVSGGMDLPFMRFGPAFLGALSLPLLAAVVLAILGGIFAFKRKAWGWVLAGSIAAIFLSWPLAIAAIVLTVMSKAEFE